MIRIIGVLIVLMFWMSKLSAQHQLTLSQCLERSMKASHLLRAASYQEDKAKVALSMSRSQRLPTVSLGTSYTRIGKLTTIEFSTSPGAPPRKLTFGTPNRVNFDVRLQVPLFTWRRIEHSIDLARLGKKFTELKTEKQRIDLTAQVLQAFYGALLNRKIVELTKENLQRKQKYFSITEKRYKAGQLPRLELLRAQVQVKNEQSNLETARGNYEKSLIFLAKTVGTPENLIEPVGELTFTPVTDDPSTILKRALARRIELQQFAMQEKMIDAQQRIIASANKPNLSLFSSYSMLNGFDPMNPEKFFTNYNIGVQLNWAIFDGFNTRYQKQSSQLDRMAVQEQKNEIEELIRMQVRQALVSIKQAEQKITAQQENIRLAKETLEMAQTQYENGFISSLDLLDAQKVLLQMEMAYWQTLFGHVTAKIELGRAMGSFHWFEDQL